MRSFLHQAARVARAHPRTLRVLAGGLMVWAAICFALGYRLPYVDRHPDWRGFPALSNPHLVVEEIPDYIFGHRYSHRFPYSRETAMVVRLGRLVGMDSDSLVEVTSGYVVRKGWLAGMDSAADIEISDGLEFYNDYRRNLKNIRSVGFQVTENKFDSDIHIHLWGSGNDVGRPSEPWSPGFRKFGYEYLQLNLGGEIGYFKAEESSESTSLDNFYQYNYPTSSLDTLFLRYGPNKTNYRVYLSKQPQRPELEWAVTNNSPDEVKLTVRYLPDSLPLTNAEQAIFKQTPQVSSMLDAWGQAWGSGPLDHMSWHKGQWYRVFAVGCINPAGDHGPDVQFDSYDPTTGVITYLLPPHGTQRLMRTPVPDGAGGRLGSNAEPAPPIAGISVRGGGIYTVRWQGDQLPGMFRPDHSVQEYDLSAPDRFCLTLGPKLKPELGFWLSSKQVFRDLFGL